MYRRAVTFCFARSNSGFFCYNSLVRSLFTNVSESIYAFIDFLEMPRNFVRRDENWLKAQVYLKEIVSEL